MLERGCAGVGGGQGCIAALLPSFGGGRFFSKETLRYGVVLGPLPARMESASPWKLAARIATNRQRNFSIASQASLEQERLSFKTGKTKGLSQEHTGGSSAPHKRHCLLLKQP